MTLLQEVNAWEDVLRGDPCAYCGASCQEIDHIDPHRGSRYPELVLDTENLTAACRRCNRSKGQKPLLAFLLYRVDPDAGRALWRQPSLWLV